MNAENDDSIKLLKECDAGTNMAISSLDEVLEKVCDPDVKQILTESKGHHEKLRDEISDQLMVKNSEEKEPNPLAKGMSWLKTNMKMGMDNCDAKIADLITDGCNMGIKSLYRYLNQYKAADEKAKNLCRRLITIEKQLRQSLQPCL